MVMSVDQILANAFAEPDVANAGFVRVLSIVSAKARYTAYNSITLTSDYQGQRKWRQKVRAKDPNYDGLLSICPAVVVECNCHRYKFMWEYALHRAGAADIVHSDGQPSSVRNPAFVPAPCKHLYKVLNYIKSKQL